MCEKVVHQRICPRCFKRRNARSRSISCRQNGNRLTLGSACRGGLTLKLESDLVTWVSPVMCFSCSLAVSMGAEQLMTDEQQLEVEQTNHMRRAPMPNPRDLEYPTQS